jgi:putative FmdB family regulatory protein
MPLYEYTCEDCHERVELLVQGTAQPVCPQCGGEHLKKEWSTFSTNEAPASSAAAPSPGCCCMGPNGACGLN